MQTAAAPMSSLAPIPSPGPSNRMYYLDALRVILTILVVLHHVGQAYGPTGGYWPVQSPTRAAILGPFFSVNRSFFMSLFFMISGYFMVASYQRNGFGAFVRSRLVRLGIPVLAFAAIMLPARIFLFGEHITRWTDYFNAAHLWYLEHVLLFSIVYGLWRLLRDRGGERPQTTDGTRRPPGLAVTVAALLLVALGCGVVRIWYPIDRWLNLLGFFRVAFADVPRDLAFFIFGALAFRRGWFASYPTGRGLGWLAVGLAAAAARYAWALVPHAAISPLANDLSYLVWEELVAFGLCIGLLVLFRQAANVQGPFGRLLSANQYGVYFWHPMLIVLIQMAIVGVPIGPLAKFVAVGLVGVPLVFLWSWLLRKTRAVRAVL